MQGRGPPYYEYQDSKKRREGTDHILWNRLFIPYGQDLDRNAVGDRDGQERRLDAAGSDRGGRQEPGRFSCAGERAVSAESVLLKSFFDNMLSSVGLLYNR